MLVAALGWQAKLFPKLPLYLPDLFPFLFFFELEFASHLVHRVADDSVLYEAALLIFAHF